MDLCPPVSVCLSQVGVLSKRLNESSWFLAGELRSTYPTLCYKDIHVASKISVLPLLQTLDLKFRHGISIVEACYPLSSRKVDAHSVINWAVVGQLSRQYLRAPTLDHCSLSHRSSGAVYSTILSRGPLATADTCFKVSSICVDCVTGRHHVPLISERVAVFGAKVL